MSKTKIRVGLIGHKFMGIAHSNAFRNVAMWTGLPYELELSCICAHDTKDNLEIFAKRYGWKSTETNWQNVVNRKDIDLVSIAVPNNLHCEIAVEAARSGKHVLCEKPMANSLDDAEKMLSEAKIAGVRHCCGFSYRFTPSLALAREMVREGRIGRIYHVFARYAQDWITDPGFAMVWRFDKNIAGSGPLGDLSAHTIDAVRFITGMEFKEVVGNMKTLIKERPVELNSPHGRKGEVTVEDVAQFLVNFEGGATGCFESTRLATGRKNYNTIEINGESGSVFWNFEDQNHLLYYDNRQGAAEAGFRKINVTHDSHPYGGGWWPQGHGIGYADTFVIEVGEFLGSIVENRPFHPDFEDGVKCQQVLDAIERSSRDSRWTDI